MEYTVCGAVHGYVYATVTADSLEEAIEIAKKDACLDWDGEEWISSPILASITDETGKITHID